MASTYERRVISIIGHGNLSIPLLECFIEDLPHSRRTYKLNQHSLMFHILCSLGYEVVKFCSYNPTHKFTCEMELQYLANHSTTIMQGVQNPTGL